MQKEHINKISKYEPSDFKQFRLNSYEMFKSSFNPIYGPTIKEDFDKYNYENIFLNIENGRKRQTHISAAADCWISTY